MIVFNIVYLHITHAHKHRTFAGVIFKTVLSVRLCVSMFDHVRACPTMCDRTCEGVRMCATVFDHAQLPEWPTVRLRALGIY